MSWAAFSASVSYSLPTERLGSLRANQKRHERPVCHSSVTCVHGPVQGWERGNPGDAEWSTERSKQRPWWQSGPAYFRPPCAPGLAISISASELYRPFSSTWWMRYRALFTSWTLLGGAQKTKCLHLRLFLIKLHTSVPSTHDGQVSHVSSRTYLYQFMDTWLG